MVFPSIAPSATGRRPRSPRPHATGRGVCEAAEVEIAKEARLVAAQGLGAPGALEPNDVEFINRR
jgi:hypothetical protein